MKEIFIIEQRTFGDESWYSIFGAETIINAEKWIKELRDMYEQHPEYGKIPQFQVRKLNIY